MQNITCNQCGHSIAEDDFVLQQCPICDSYMSLNRLNKKADSSLSKIVRIDPVQHSALVDCGLKD